MLLGMDELLKLMQLHVFSKSGSENSA